MSAKPKSLRIKPGEPASATPQRRPLISPWWDGVARTIMEMPGLMGKMVSVDELVALILGTPGADSKRIRNMAVVRRLAPILELVERGPNGSLSRGARYKIVETAALIDDEFLNEEWLTAAANKMGGKIKP